MKPPDIPARLHILPAKHAPTAIVIRRKPSDTFHILRWNTQTDEIEHGSWFTGRIYPWRCDVSPDGNWMVYLAQSADASTSWNGICQPPWLRTTLDWENSGTWHGGGCFLNQDQLLANPGYSRGNMAEALRKNGKLVPFKVSESLPHPYGEDEGVLFFRLIRDGYAFAGPPAPKDAPGPPWAYAPDDQKLWQWKFSPEHPLLSFRYLGYEMGRGRVFSFQIEGAEELLKEANWATWDSLGQLLVAREGRLERYTLECIQTGAPASTIDLERLVPPRVGKPPKLIGAIAERLLPEVVSPFRVVDGNPEDQEVAAIVVEAFGPSKESARVWQLAGDYAEVDRETLQNLKEGEFTLTPGYYFRQHTIVWVKPPVNWQEVLERLNQSNVPSLAVGELAQHPQVQQILKRWTDSSADCTLKEIVVALPESA